MHSENKKDLCKYRIKKAYECLSSAKLLRDSGDYTSSANRSYYSFFHAMRAVMALDGEDRKKHSGVISYFQENYIKNGIFDKKFSYMIKSAFQVRQESDYEDFSIISVEDVKEQIENAEEFIIEIEQYIETVIK